MPDPSRVQSGILVESSDTSLLADVGSGVLHRLVQHKFNFMNLDAVFISHFHVDHCSDFLTLCQTLWLSGYDRRLVVYGPPMIIDWLSTLRDAAFPYLSEKVEVEVRTLEANREVTVGDMKILNVPTKHGTMDTRAFRFEDDDSALAFSSDTAPSDAVIGLASKVDVLIHECNWLDGPHPEGVHTSPSELASIVGRAAPRRLILNHVSPEVVAKKEEVLNIVAAETDARVIMGEDLMAIADL